MHNLSEQTAIILKNICIKITYYSFLYIFCACLFSAVSFVIFMVISIFLSIIR